MISDPATFALGALFGFAIGALTIIGLGLVLDARDKRRRCQQALDNACNELERGGE